MDDPLRPNYHESPLHSKLWGEASGRTARKRDASGQGSSSVGGKKARVADSDADSDASPGAGGDAAAAAAAAAAEAESGGGGGGSSAMELEKPVAVPSETRADEAAAEVVDEHAGGASGGGGGVAVAEAAAAQVAEAASIDSGAAQHESAVHESFGSSVMRDSLVAAFGEDAGPPAQAPATPVGGSSAPPDAASQSSDQRAHGGGSAGAADDSEHDQRESTPIRLKLICCAKSVLSKLATRPGTLVFPTFKKWILGGEKGTRMNIKCVLDKIRAKCAHGLDSSEELCLLEAEEAGARCWTEDQHAETSVAALGLLPGDGGVCTLYFALKARVAPTAAHTTSPSYSPPSPVFTVFLSHCSRMRSRQCGQCKMTRSPPTLARDSPRAARVRSARRLRS